jgi:Ca2+-binding RTX toxin-like protein
MNVAVVPSILDSPTNKHEAHDLNHEVDHLLKDVDDMLRDPFAEKHDKHHHHGGSDGHSDGGHDPVVSGNDTIDGGLGDDVILGDNGIIRALFETGATTDNVKFTVEPEKGWGSDGHSDWDWRTGDDLISGGEGNDLLFGQEGRDTLEGGDGDDILDGGSGEDILWGDDGNDQLFGGSGHDSLDGGDGKDKVKKGSQYKGSHGHSDGGIDITSRVQNPWLKGFLSDIADARDDFDENSALWLTFKEKGHHHGGSDGHSDGGKDENSKSGKKR